MLSSDSEDYEKGGLLYCGKCNTPKQAYIEGFKRNMPVPCKCKQEQIQKEEELRERIKKQSRIAELRYSTRKIFTPPISFDIINSKNIPRITYFED